MKDTPNTKIATIQCSGYNGSEPLRVCPKCKVEKPISEFGFRIMSEDGQIRNQSYCRKCR